VLSRNIPIVKEKVIGRKMIACVSLVCEKTVRNGEVGTKGHEPFWLSFKALISPSRPLSP
jgi:hypothetical protein